MKNVKYAWLLAAFAVACASNSAAPPAEDPDPEIDPDAANKLPPPEGPPAECRDEAGDPIECSSDDDCCPGFYCGLDPEGSTRIKTCVYGGE